MTICNLGGPGSGKITHCEQMTREKTSFVHISMADIMNTMLKGTG
jgi:adenylate kinase family enzyme